MSTQVLYYDSEFKNTFTQDRSPRYYTLAVSLKTKSDNLVVDKAHRYFTFLR